MVNIHSFSCVVSLLYFSEEVKERTKDLLEKIESKLYNYEVNTDARGSIVWQCFRIILNDKNEQVDQFFYCVSCGDIQYCARSDGSTTQLLRHSCVKSLSAGQSTLQIDTRSIEKLKKAAAKCVCLGLRPINSIECEGVRELFRAGIELGQKFPKANVDDLMKFFQVEKLPKQR